MAGRNMCMAWHPIWVAISRETRVPRPTVMAIFFAVSATPAAHIPTAETVAESIGARKPDAASRVLVVMQARGILNDNHRPTAEWMIGDEVTAGVTTAVTRGAGPMTGAERQARYKARKRAENMTGDGSASPASPSVTQASLSLSSDQQIVDAEENKKETRAHERDLETEFDAFIAHWPVPSPREPALRAYRVARRSASAEELIAGLERYIACKPEWQSYCHAAKFLNEKRWRDAAVQAEPDTPAFPGPTEAPKAIPHMLGEPGERLRRAIGDTPFRSWFRSVTLDCVRDGGVYLTAPTASVRARINEHYQDPIKAAWRVSSVEIAVEPVRQQREMLMPIRGGGSSDRRPAGVIAAACAAFAAGPLRRQG